MNLIQTLKQTCQSKGDKVAVISSGIKLSYHDLWEQSDNLAAWLIANHHNQNPIIVYGHKDPLMLVCFLACAKSGHPYCPVDISVPYVRILDIINEIEKPLILATENFEAPNCTILQQDAINELLTSKSLLPDSNYDNLDPSTTMYIIFTSGSSGKPKGVEISMENLKNFTDWSATLFSEAPCTKPQTGVARQSQIDDADGLCAAATPNKAPSGNVMNQAPFSFDLSVMDTYTSMVTGRTLCLLPKSKQQEVKDTLEFIEENQIAYMVSTPSFANMLLADRNFTGENFPHIRQFLFCGETLTKETANSLLQRFPQARILNTYGPTESTVAVTQIPITRDHIESDASLPIGICEPATQIPITRDHIESDASLPIGTTKPGTVIYIENEEIIIAGNTVGKGYYKDEEKTKAAFFTHPQTGQPCYRTGDKGYIKGDLLYYCGRIDKQIKLHGYRIELGDIESNLIQLPNIKDAVVLPKYKDGQIRSLTAFITTWNYAAAEPPDTSTVMVDDSYQPSDPEGGNNQSANAMDGNNQSANAIGYSYQLAKPMTKVASDYETAKAIKAALAEKLPHYMIPKKIKIIEEMPLTNNGKKDTKKLAELI